MLASCFCCIRAALNQDFTTDNCTRLSLVVLRSSMSSRFSRIHEFRERLSYGTSDNSVVLVSPLQQQWKHIKYFFHPSSSSVLRTISLNFSFQREVVYNTINPPTPRMLKPRTMIATTRPEDTSVNIHAPDQYVKKQIDKLASSNKCRV